MQLFSPEFFNLQIRFAQKIGLISNKSTFDVLVEYTILRFLLYLYVVPKREAEPLWFELVRRIEKDDNPQEWVYSLYQTRLNIIIERERQRIANAFGCFSYAYPFQATPSVRIHFHNRPDLSKQGLLSDFEVDSRLSELQQLFRHIKQTHPEAKTVVGGSWMYHLNAYRRLFPPTYLQTAKSGGYETGFFALWGQFVHGNGRVREPMSTLFLECLIKQKTLSSCLSCFPYDVLRLEGSIEIFYEYYGI